jgi:3-oxosteroid 1-dehydrogenase
MTDWNSSADFVVVGSGAAALSGAIRAHDLGASVRIFEKSDQYGGSTAMSGGVCWVANNPDMAAVTGIGDSDEDALTYLRHITRGEVDDKRLETYLTESKRLVRYFAEKTHVRFDPLVRYTDYYPEAPGGRPGGRSMESRPFDGTVLGDELRHLRPPHPQSQIMGKFGITAGQAHGILVPGLRAKLLILWWFLLYALRFRKRAQFGRDTRLVTGNALIGRLRRSLQDRGVEVERSVEVVELVRDGERIVGVVIKRGEGGAIERVEARRGVLLAAGGFERNLAMRETYQPTPTSDQWTAANPHNQGDGIRMGIDAGATLALMDDAWWTPTTLVPKSPLAWVLVVEKSLPGSIFVDQSGARFVNEAAPYIDVVKRTYEAHAKGAPCVPCWMVFDARYRKNYPVGPVAPGYAMPDGRVPRRYRDGFLVKAATVDELAAKIDVDPAGLAATIERFNDMARRGKDEDFGRGDSGSDRYYSDHRVGPNPCLAPLDTAPFYAIRVYPGDLGTKGGLVTDEGGRVLDREGAPIPGLYAAGNTSASVMGPTYPGAGGTIGPALTFGFLAAESACQ